MSMNNTASLIFMSDSLLMNNGDTNDSDQARALSLKSAGRHACTRRFAGFAKGEKRRVRAYPREQRPLRQPEG